MLKYLELVREWFGNKIEKKIRNIYKEGIVEK